MRTAAYYATTALAAVALAGCGTTTQWTMPNLVGQNLQDAQNNIQELTDGSVDTTSHDQAPADREQASDRDWKVCQQSIEAGKVLTEESSVEFAVVKNDEKC